MKVWRKSAFNQLIRYVYKIVVTETVTVIRQKKKVLQLGISSPIGDIKLPVGDNIPNWRLGINDSGKAESEKQSPILNRIKYHKMGI